MTTFPSRPAPNVDPDNKPYWDFLRRHELQLQRCTSCRAFRFPCAPLCPDCGSGAYRWTRCSGHGTIYSWVVFHKSYFPWFDHELPYNVAIIQLAEGPMVIANLVGIANEDIRKGLAVEVVYDDTTIPGFTIPRFRVPQ